MIIERGNSPAGTSRRRLADLISATFVRPRRPCHRLYAAACNRAARLREDLRTMDSRSACRALFEGAELELNRESRRGGTEQRAARDPGHVLRRLKPALVGGLRGGALVFAHVAAAESLADLPLTVADSEQIANAGGPAWCNAGGNPDSFKAVTGGYVCAVRPSITAAAGNPIWDYDKTPGANDLDDRRCGFGSHAIGVPISVTNNDWRNLPVFIHFVGTYVRPYDSGGISEITHRVEPGPQNCERCDGIGCTVSDLIDPYAGAGYDPAGQYEDEQVVRNGVEAGFLVLEIAHTNFDSNYDICTQSDEKCGEEVRKEIITGTGGGGQLDVTAANSIKTRMKRLVTYLSNQGILLPDSLSAASQWGVKDWTKIRLGGHSGGSGHAYYMAKYLQTLISAPSPVYVENVCLLSGPFDKSDDTPPDTIACDATRKIADWYKPTPDVYFPPSHLRAVRSIWDTAYSSFEFSHCVLGIDEGVEVAEITEEDYCYDTEAIDCAPGDVNHLKGHNAIPLAPALDWARTMACFAPMDADYVAAPMINLDMDEVCGAQNPIDMADFIAANPGAFTDSNCSLWGCNQCGFWDSPLDPTQAATEVCLFDAEVYSAEHPGVAPKDARANYEAGGYLDVVADDHYCSDLANTKRGASGY